MDTILCIDIGTTSLKAGLLSDRRTVEAYSRQAFKAKDAHKVADEWIFALKNAVSEMKEQNEKAAVEAVCVSGNGPTLVAEGNFGNFSVLWNERFEDAEKSNSIFIPRFLEFRENFTEIWNSAERIFSGPEFLICELTGNPISILPEERFQSAYWTREILMEAGFSKSEIEKIPPFSKMGAFAGKICSEAAKRTGLLEGTLVFAGAPDFVAALLGTGTIYPGTVCDRAGSSEGVNLCTSRPIFGEGIRTLPSFMPGLWNASVIIEKSGILVDSGKTDEILAEFSKSVERLRKAAEEHGETFPKSMRISGGQARNRELVEMRERASGMEIEVPWCPDAELIGDLILAQVALGDYDDLDEACFALC